ncbi:unnamed protein product [Linum trigynum]|uniref:Uncharacterized protein n=1 Tax=Linum trigynum TaxID=586398 RepID=A0AAV2EZ59_9ROSI
MGEMSIFMELEMSFGFSELIRIAPEEDELAKHRKGIEELKSELTRTPIGREIEGRREKVHQSSKNGVAEGGLESECLVETYAS